jgi:hypothetical protein
MFKILIISDIHADIENILNFLDKLKEYKFDLVVCPGDLIDINLPKGFTERDLAKIIIEELRILKKPLLIVPGNMDGKIIDLLEEERVSLHGNGIKFKDYGIYGYGGAKTPFGTMLEPSEIEMENGLRRGFAKVEDVKYKIQVTHMPPARTKVDILFSGAHVGSETIRKFIEENEPILAISAHIHEARGIDKINNTVLINSGKFSEGYFGLVEIEDGNVKAKILNLI